MTYILAALSVVLLFFWYLNKKSKNNFFFQDEKIIRKKLDLILIILDDFGWGTFDKEMLKISFRYFIENPSEYNGTSIINDNWVVNGLEPESVIHDYEDIMATNLKHSLKSNFDYAERLRKRNVNWCWCWIFIYIGLTIVSFFKSVKYINFRD